jgi:uncharacterized protein (TIGR03663 family)
VAKKAKKRQDAAGATEITASQAALESEVNSATGLFELTPRVWQIACLVVMAATVFLRLYDLNLKPMHHDEGVNGFFLTDLYRNGKYHYDPNNYHGPTLYFFSLAVSAIGGVLFGKDAGLSTFAVRLTTVLFGIGTVWLIFALRKKLGDLGTLAAAALLAVSPGMVFISRYFIHEMLFAFFTVGMVVAFVKYSEAPPPDADKREFGYWSAVSAVLLALFAYYTATRPASFKLLAACVLMNMAACAVTLYKFEGPRSLSFIFGAACAALLFGTKETAFISVGVLLIAAVSAQIYLKYLHPALFGKGRVNEEVKESLLKRLQLDAPRLALLTVIGLGIFLYLSIIFYSSFFTYPEGLPAAIESLQVWSKTGQRDHNSPYYKYIQWLMTEEGALLALYLVGAVCAFFWQRARRFAVFIALWGLGITAAYSLIPYKTPWLAINFLPPFAIAAGYGIGQIYGNGRNSMLRQVALALAGVALAFGLYQAYQLNFLHYDEDDYVYVYAHTRRSFHDLTGKVDQALARSPAKKDTGISITSPEYWPLPWYFRNYPKAGFIGGMTETPEDIVIGRKDQLEVLQAKLGGNYKYYGLFDMRPGVELVLFIKNDIAP